MFFLSRAYNGYQLPDPTLYVDTIGDPYQFEEITLVATAEDSSLDLTGVQAICRFNGDPFPLSGADYLTAVTGTLEITVTQQLATGLYWIPFMCVTETLIPVAGFALHGLVPDGIAAASQIALAAGVKVQSFPIPGVSLAPAAMIPTSVPSGYPRRFLT
jgi:hypothetical protein